MQGKGVFMDKQAGKWALSDDWLALNLGLVVFLLSLGVFGGIDILGWGIKTSTWMDPTKALSVASQNYAPVKGEIVKIEGLINDNYFFPSTTIKIPVLLG